jgi:hypothetical protein
VAPLIIERARHFARTRLDEWAGPTHTTLVIAASRLTIEMIAFGSVKLDAAQVSPLMSDALLRGAMGILT